MYFQVMYNTSTPNEWDWLYNGKYVGCSKKFYVDLYGSLSEGLHSISTFKNIHALTWNYAIYMGRRAGRYDTHTASNAANKMR